MSEKRQGNGGGIDTELVRELAQVLAEQNLTEIELEHGELRLRLTRSHPNVVAYAPQPAAYAAPPPAAAPAPAPVVAAAPAVEVDLRDDPRAVKSPMVGTSYLAAEPGATPFIRVGDKVNEGQTLLIVEAMKTFNPIAAPRSGVVTRILVVDGQPVEYGEPLMILE